VTLIAHQMPSVDCNYLEATPIVNTVIASVQKVMKGTVMNV
jgi:hypothetical protein